MNVLNPIFDSSFKFLMEDEKSARVLLSRLLKRQVVKLVQRPQESIDNINVRPDTSSNGLNVYRLDYAATVVLDDGQEEDVCIELQKVWLKSELIRFRKYLGGQYSNDKNLCQDGETPMHIVAIYLLGHKISETEEPIIYCRDNTMTDFDGKPIEDSGKGDFIRSLTHDLIIVQIPRLAPKPRNATERILSIFDQRNVVPENRRLITVPDSTEIINDSAYETVKKRLLEGSASPSMLRTMQIESEILSEFDYRDTQIEEYKTENAKIKTENEQIKAENEAIKTKSEAMANNAISALLKNGVPPESVASILNIDIESVRKLM